MRKKFIISIISLLYLNFNTLLFAAEISEKNAWLSFVIHEYPIAKDTSLKKDNKISLLQHWYKDFVMFFPMIGLDLEQSKIAAADCDLYINVYIRQALEKYQENQSPFELFSKVMQKIEIISISSELGARPYGWTNMTGITFAKDKEAYENTTWQDFLHISQEISDFLSNFHPPLNKSHRSLSHKQIKLENGDIATYQVGGKTGEGCWGEVYYATLLKGNGPFEICLKFPKTASPMYRGEYNSSINYVNHERELVIPQERIFSILQEGIALEELNVLENRPMGLIKILGRLTNDEVGLALNYFPQLGDLKEIIDESNEDEVAKQITLMLKYLSACGYDNHDFGPNLFAYRKNGQWHVASLDYNLSKRIYSGKFPEQAFLSLNKCFFFRPNYIKKIRNYYDIL